MSRIETLISQIEDAALRDEIAREVAEMKKRLDWGLVFERHLPENVRTLLAPIKVGSVVWERRSTTPRRLRVRAVQGTSLTVVAETEKETSPMDAPTEQIARWEVLVEQDFSQPIYPFLIPIGETRNGPADRPYHVVVEGENYHTIQALLNVYEREVDVIYLDPPYNTGDQDWSYNNDYIDPKDTYRPSKWLAFMERRLRIARRLLKSDGVMVVTIDENEVHHLGMLLEQIFPEARVQMASIVNNPNGQDRLGLARVDEQAYFVFFNEATAVGQGDDMLAPEGNQKGVGVNVRWEWLLRGGDGSGRGERGSATLFYPVLLDVKTKKIMGAGPSMISGDPDINEKVEGWDTAWPIRSDGSWGRWRIGQDKLRRLLSQGYVRLGGYDEKRRTWTVLYVSDKTVDLIERGTIQVLSRDANGVANLGFADTPRVSIKTVWNRKRHNAGVYGSHLLTSFLGERGAFTFPKSLYAVKDTIAALTYDKPDALVLDFFAGSGTTLHATVLLNAEDGGTRRCILVTNNELKHAVSARLHRKGLFRGDDEFEAAGVFEAVTRPRVTAAVTGKLADGEPIEGVYLGLAREYKEGFAENVEFFRLGYTEAAEVEFGLRAAEIHPLLWLRAGGIGEREAIDSAQPLYLPSKSPYAVLFDPSGIPALLGSLPSRPDITHVFIVADSQESFTQLVDDIPPRIEKVRLYSEYLETMRGATRWS